jgi:hypothetical protein
MSAQKKHTKLTTFPLIISNTMNLWYRLIIPGSQKKKGLHSGIELIKQAWGASNHGGHYFQPRERVMGNVPYVFKILR